MIQVEICAPSARSARSAKEGGASRVELCRDLPCGGLTPSDEDIAYCVGTLGLRTHVLVRPRAGNFCYSAAEVAEIGRTVERCRALGAAAVVVGFLTLDGHVDVELTRQVVQMAAPMEVTFHRAFDEASQPPLEALRAVAAAGCHRLLTSGQAPTALEGAATIRSLVGITGVRVMAGAGVTPENVEALVRATGVSEVHGSCKRMVAGEAPETDAGVVARLINKVLSI